MRFVGVVALLLAAGCATTRVVHLDTGNGKQIAYESVEVEPVEVKTGPVHHICTNKNPVSNATGGPWTPECERIFKKAGMTLEDAANKVRLDGHEGPHPEFYHNQVMTRLERSVARCRTTESCRVSLLKELAKIANELLTPGSELRSFILK